MIPLSPFLGVRVFRDGTEFDKTPFTFAYNAGGIGDFINWTTAIQYAIETHPWLEGKVLAPAHFFELALLWLRKYEPRFVVLPQSGPVIHLETRGLIPDDKQTANATGLSLFECGFIYFNQMGPRQIPREWRRLPEIRGDEASIEKFCLPEKYVVLTPAATAENKRLRSEALNELKVFLVEQGFVPVLLGKFNVAPDHKGVSSPMDTSSCIDLRDETTLIEAACIMAGARAVIGLDNGLLHLAACSKVRIVWAFTSADPHLVIPPGCSGRVLVISPPEDLKCRFCHSRMKFVLGHDFKKCLYGDNLCVESITGKLLIEAARQILSLNGN